MRLQQEEEILQNRNDYTAIAKLVQKENVNQLRNQ